MVGVCQYSCRIFIFHLSKAEPPYGRLASLSNRGRITFPLLGDEGYLIILKDYAPVNFLFLLKDSTPPIDVESISNTF